MKKTILFIGHDATRTGAPILLRDFIHWLKMNKEVEIIILLKNGGPLLSDYLDLGTTFVFNKVKKAKGFRRPIASIRSRWGKKQIVNKLKKSKIDIIYSNTITNGFLYDYFKFKDIPIITHVHELNRVINNFTGNDLFQIKKHTKRFIAASTPVRDNLVVNHQIPENAIRVINEFTHIEKFENTLNEYPRIDTLKEIGLPDDNMIVVGASGRFDLRKGADLFIQVANRVLKEYPGKYYFIWIGGKHEGDLYNWLSEDVIKAGLTNGIKIIEPVTNPQKYFASLDIFLMTSREDPYPLVNLEAAILETPVICFDKGGGTVEFVGKDAGVIVPYADTYAMAQAIIRLGNDEKLRLDYAKNAAEKVRSSHDINQIGPKLYEEIEKLW